MRHSLLAALVFGVVAAVPSSSASALSLAPFHGVGLVADHCILNPTFTLVTRDGSREYPQTYTVTRGTDGYFTGRTADGSQTVSGRQIGEIFSLTATYTNGYKYSVYGKMDNAGTITGTGTDSENKQLTFAINGGTSCNVAGGGHHTGTPGNPHHGGGVATPPATGGNNNASNGKGCPAAPAVANAYIKSLPAHGNRHRMNHGSVISRVARHMGKRNMFDGSAPCDTDYAAKVRTYVDGLHNRR